MKKMIGAGVVCMVCVAFVGLSVAEDAMPVAPVAEDVVKAVPKVPAVRRVPKQAPAVETQDVVMKGVIGKVERPGKEGKSAKVAYMLTDAEGNVTRLPESKKAKEGEAAIDLASLVGAEVTVTGKGVVHEKKGKRMVQLRSVSAVAKVAAQE